MKSPQLFIGIDPGLNGAVAVIDEDCNVLLVEDLPIVLVERKNAKVRRWTDKKTGEKKTSKSTHFKELDFKAVDALFRRIKKLKGKKNIYIERVASRLTDGVIQAFVFGGAFWSLRQTLACLKLNYKKIEAKDWQKYSMSNIPKDKGERKKAYLEKARELFPSVSLPHVKDNEKAAALLISYFCRGSKL